MARVAVQTQGRSGVLHRAVGVEEQRGHGAYLGAASLLEQRLDPARVDDLRVVVEEDENVGAGRAGGGIVERGEVERPVVAHHGDAGTTLETSQEVQRGLLSRPV